MNRLALQKALKKIDQFGFYVFTAKDLRAYFPNEPISTFKASLARHVTTQLLENPCRGVYLNPDAKCRDSVPLEHIAKVLRRGEYSYISLESLLSEASIISQVPINLLTVMTTGRSQLYHTSYGDIEFVHTKQSVNHLLKHTHKINDRPLRIASEKLALEDLKHVNRNLHLINNDEVTQ